MGALASLVGRMEWWLTALITVTLASLALVVLDWNTARFGAAIDVVIIGAVLIDRRFAV
jgi:hypothetical protein